MEEPDMAGWQIGGPNSRQESAHFKVCLRQRGGFLAAPIHWLLTAQQVRSCRLNCYVYPHPNILSAHPQFHTSPGKYPGLCHS